VPSWSPPPQPSRASLAPFPTPSLPAVLLCSENAGKTQRCLSALQRGSISLPPGCCSRADSPLFVLFLGGSPESPGACHRAVEMAALLGGTIHLPHAFETQRARRQPDAPVPRALSASAWDAAARHRGSAVVAPPCREVSAARRQELLLNQLLSLGYPHGPAAICVLQLVEASQGTHTKIKRLNVKPAAWGFAGGATCCFMFRPC